MCQRAAVLDHDAAPTADLSCATSPIGCRTEVREGKTSPFWQMGQDAYRKISKIRNCVTWVTTKLFLHTQVWWWHEANFPDPPLDPS